MIKTPVEIKYNRTTRFILPALRLNDEKLLQNHFVNAYLQDNEYDIRWDLENCIFLLFKSNLDNPSFENFCQTLRELEGYKDEYDIKEGVVFVIQIPKEYNDIIDTFISGEYSKFNQKYIKNCIPQMINGKISKRWKIFYKEQSLFNELATFLGYKDMELAKQYINELEDKPYAEDEILRYDPSINTRLTRRND